MVKTLKAYGVLYTVGEKIGTSDYTIDKSDLESIVAASPKKVPLMLDMTQFNDIKNVMGNAEMTLNPDGRLEVTLTLNETGRRVYEPVLQSIKGRETLRLGFMLRGVIMDKEAKKVTNGYISLITLDETCLGGHIYKYGWEDSNE